MSYKPSAGNMTTRQKIGEIEELFETYKQTTGNEVDQTMKTAVLLRLLAPELKRHVQLFMSNNDTTYSQLKDLIADYDRATSTWTPNMVKPHPTTTSGDSQDMDIDRVGKGKGKYPKGKGKGKFDWSKNGKGGGKDNFKGKGKSKKGDAKGGGNFPKGKGKGKPGKGPRDQTCHYCGGTNHWIAECWKKQRDDQIRNVNVNSTAGAGSATSNSNMGQNSSGQSNPAAVNFSSNVRRVTTYVLCEDDDEPEPFHDNFQNHVIRTVQFFDISDEHDFAVDQDECVSMYEEHDWTMQHFHDSKTLEARAVWTSDNHLTSADNLSTVILDSGADVSVVPQRYAHLGEPLLDEKLAQLRDAQGRVIQSSRRRKFEFVTETADGELISLVEKAYVGNVQEPLLCAGSLFRNGWEIRQGEQGLELRHPDTEQCIQMDMCKGSLTFHARIFAISADEPKGDSQTDAENTFEVRPARQFLEAVEFNPAWDAALQQPGWSIIGNGVPVFYAPQATHYLDPSPTFGPGSFPYRLTLWKQDEFWEVVEPATKYMELDEDERFRELETERPLETLTFFGSVNFTWEDVKAVEEEAFDFEAIVDEGIEPVPEGEQPEEPAQPVSDAQPPPQIVPHADKDELVIDNNLLTPENTLAELRQAALFMGISSAGSKAKLWRRLVSKYLELDMQSKIEISQKLMREQQRDPEVPRIPKIPDDPMVVELHQATHLPFQPWCSACVATRSKSDHHQELEDRDREELPCSVVSFDYGYTAGGNGKTFLVAADKHTKMVLTVPTTHKGGKMRIHLATELSRFALHCNPLQTVLQTDQEPATKQLLSDATTVLTKAGCKVTKRFAQVGDHEAQGRVERQVQTLRNLGMCLIAHLEDQVKGKIRETSPVVDWAYKHAAFLKNMYMVDGRTRMTPWEALTGRRYTSKVAIFGEIVFAQIKALKGQPTWQKAVWLTKDMVSDSHLVGTAQGVIRTRCIRRIPDRFSLQHILAMRGAPWNYKLDHHDVLFEKQQPRDAVLEDEAGSEPETLFEEDLPTREQLIGQDILPDETPLVSLRPSVLRTTSCSCEFWPICSS